ncbi:hypothetical protein [Bifidobacterium tibiigranuli]|uniref:Uncharacterized protein n=1 Tax=Bifidobacterium tibiigranuli TaxID=2172043 RepID=A0A5N6RXY8_9BIFI|nr:hypothetical protein [Bifidobacterium tibiigranuli]KAE8127288.1 hypothetical protein DDF78_08680 [Bifidobacterium tibiigranuli]KAE8129679.1 hypothetical protein DDE84_02460 [Bifidobacterium tibiigranuli]
MSGVYDDDRTVRADLLLRRGSSIRRAVVTEVQTTQTGPFAPLDMSGWTGRFVLAGPDGTWWWSTGLTLTADGYAIVDIPPDAFKSDVWYGRRSGIWRMQVMGTDRHVERIGEGYWHLS